MSGASPAPETTPPDDASRHARAAARIVFGAMGVAVLIALAITVVGLRMRDAPDVSPAVTSDPPPTASPSAATTAARVPVRVEVETFTTGAADPELVEFASDLSDAAIEALRPLPGVVPARRVRAVETTRAEATEHADSSATTVVVLVLRGTLTSSDGRLRLDLSLARDAVEGAPVEMHIEQPATQLFALRAALTRELRRGLGEARTAAEP